MLENDQARREFDNKQLELANKSRLSQARIDVFNSKLNHMADRVAATVSEAWKISTAVHRVLEDGNWVAAMVKENIPIETIIKLGSQKTL